MDKKNFDVILDASDANFAEDLRKALDLKEGDTIQLIHPQFDRVDGIIVQYFPNTPEEYAALPNLSRDNLFKIGCGIWEETETQTHWLYPKEWYAHIPNGTKIVSINGEEELFEKDKTDNDYRFGCLAYGFLQERK